MVTDDGNFLVLLELTCIARHYFQDSVQTIGGELKSHKVWPNKQQIIIVDGQL